MKLNKNMEELGYHEKRSYFIYGVSKAALIALTRVEVRQWPRAKNVLVLSVSPGYCSTDLNYRASDARSPELGVDAILYVTTAPANELVNGQFYEDG
jgi:NAD(P)-dependent dehydrogenase (short-subunit alcohol dehydrogenase family)